MKNVVLFCLFIFSYTLFSQSLTLFDVDATNFPIIKAKFFAFDRWGNQITNLSPSDFELKENGVKRNVTLVSCPTPRQPEPISSVLVIDVSGSMRQYLNKNTQIKNIDIAKEACKAWINGLPSNVSWECAITAFDTRNYLIRDFTNDKNSLLESIDRLIPSGGTNYDAAFIDPSAGGIRIAEKGKYKRVLVFLSDGQPNFEPQTSEIIRQARTLGVIVYAVTLRMPCPQCIKDITTQTGGQWFENVTTVDEASAVYLRILQLALNSGEPCSIEWKSDYSCERNRNVDLTYLANNSKCSLSYITPETSVSMLEVAPSTISYGLVVPPSTKDATLTIKAKNRPVTVNGIRTTNPRFTIIDYGGSNPPFVLNNDEQRMITIRYTAPDSGFVFSWVEIESDACMYDGVYLSAGAEDKIANTSLRLIHPNGGEEFLVGSDTVFVWEGVLPSDTVILEYSTDGGTTWNLISDKATGLRYVWKGVPNTPSRRCVGRVRKPGTDCSYSVQKIASLPFHLFFAEGIYVPIENKIFVFGGLFDPSTDNLSNKILIYDVDKDSWKISRSNLPYGILGQGFTTDNNSKIYISPQLGPKTNGGWGLHRKLIEYDFRNEIAREIGPDISSTNIWGCDLVYHKGYIYIFGGWNGSAISTISKYSIKNNTITVLTEKLPRASHFDNVFIKDDLVYLVGGWTARSIQVFNLNTERIELKGTFQTSDILDGWDFTVFNFCKDTSLMITPRSFQCFKFNLETGSIWETKIPDELLFLVSNYKWLPQEVELPDGRIILFGGVKKSGEVTNECYLLTPTAGNGSQLGDTSDSLWSIVTPQFSLGDINMGTVCIGSYKDTVLSPYIENSLNFPLRIDSIAITGSNANDFYFVSGFAPPPFVLSPGEKRVLEIGFHPTGEGWRESNLNIYIGNYVVTKKLIGYGVNRNIEVNVKNIVFTDVEVRRSKDTIVSAVIVNNGPVPILVLATRLVGPDLLSFSIASGGGNFTLNPGEGRTISIRFSPTKIGRSQCYLEFVTVNDCQNPLVELFGNGVKCSPIISTSNLPPINLICEITHIDSVKIMNSGCDTLNILRAEFIGADASSFSPVPPFQPFELLPDSFAYIHFQFKPNRAGVHNASIVFYSNADPDSVLTISVTASKELVDFRVSTDTLDLGVLCPNETRDTVLSIHNIGTIPIGIEFIGDNSLQPSLNNLTLDVNEDSSVWLHFSGLPTEGAFSRKIVLQDTICGGKKEVVIKGEVTLPRISIENLEIAAVHGSFADAQLVIRNTGSREVEIVSITGVTFPFELLGPSLPIKLDVNETIELTIRYTPNDKVNDSISIQIYYLPCDQMVSVNIVGLPLTASATLSTIEIEGTPGDRISIPIILSKGEHLLAAGVQNIDVDLEFNPTLLYPVRYPIERIDEKRAKIRVKDLPINQQIGTTIGEVECIVGLGNEEKCELILSNPEIKSGVADVFLVNGQFRLKGICREGGARLLNLSARTGILNIMPNPAEESFDVEVSIGEVGFVEISLLNLLGEKVKNIIGPIPMEQGKYNFRVNTSDLNKGLNILQLRTPSVIENKIIIIR